MCAQKQPAPGLFRSVLTNRCPHCRKGKLFLARNPYNLKHTLDMPQQCVVCGQKFELQEGFYYGTGYVSYGLSVGFTALCFVAWWLTLGISIKDNSIFWWLGINTLLLILLQPVLQRLSRSIWIAFFVSFEPEGSLPAETA